MEGSDKQFILELLKLIGDPFLIVALVVVYLMYRLLQRKEQTFDSSLNDVFQELRKMSALYNDQASAIKILVEMVIRYSQIDKTRKEDDE